MKQSWLKREEESDFNHRNQSYIPKPLICIYTNQAKNEFAIGLEKDENFRAITNVGESYTRFVDAYDQIINDSTKFKYLNTKLIFFANRTPNFDIERKVYRYASM